MFMLPLAPRPLGLATAVIGVTIASAPAARLRFGRENAFCIQPLEARGAAVALAGSRLRVTQSDAHPDRGPSAVATRRWLDEQVARIRSEAPAHPSTR